MNDENILSYSLENLQGIFPWSPQAQTTAKYVQDWLAADGDADTNSTTNAHSGTPSVNQEGVNTTNLTSTSRSPGQNTLPHAHQILTTPDSAPTTPEGSQSITDVTAPTPSTIDFDHVASEEIAVDSNFAHNPIFIAPGQLVQR